MLLRGRGGGQEGGHEETASTVGHRPPACGCNPVVVPGSAPAPPRWVCTVAAKAQRLTTVLPALLLGESSFSAGNRGDFLQLPRHAAFTVSGSWSPCGHSKAPSLGSSAGRAGTSREEPGRKGRAGCEGAHGRCCVPSDQNPCPVSPQDLAEQPPPRGPGDPAAPGSTARPRQPAHPPGKDAYAQGSAAGAGDSPFFLLVQKDSHSFPLEETKFRRTDAHSVAASSWASFPGTVFGGQTSEPVSLGGVPGLHRNTLPGGGQGGPSSR